MNKCKAQFQELIFFDKPKDQTKISLKIKFLTAINFSLTNSLDAKNQQLVEKIENRLAFFRLMQFFMVRFLKILQIVISPC